MGAVPGVAAAIYQGSPEAAHTLASWLSLTQNIPGSSVFHVRPNGPDALHKMRIGGSAHDLRAKLDRYGISNRILMPRHDGYDVLVPDKGKALVRNVKTMAEQQGVDLQSSTGFLKSMGSGDQAKARDLFRTQIARSEHGASKMKRLFQRLRGRVMRYAGRKVTPELLNQLFRNVPLAAYRAQPWRRGYDPIPRMALGSALESIGRKDEGRLLKDVTHPVYWDESGVHSIPELSKQLVRTRPRHLPSDERQHFETALWSSVDDMGVPLDSNFEAQHIDPDVAASMLADYRQFRTENAHHIQDATDYVPYDFWLSRNGQGAGFFDRDIEHANDLQDAARRYGEFNLTSTDEPYAHVTGDAYVSNPGESNAG
jgi:hypothetical protein